MATEQFGMVAGIAMVIGTFPTFISHSFMIMLIPTISKANAERNIEQLQRLLQQIMLLTFLYGIPAVVACYLFAEPFNKHFLSFRQVLLVICSCLAMLSFPFFCDATSGLFNWTWTHEGCLYPWGMGNNDCVCHYVFPRIKQQLPNGWSYHWHKCGSHSINDDALYDCL